jgi:hypothetical protein
VTLPSTAIYTSGQTITQISRATVTGRDAMGVEQRSSTPITITDVPVWQESTTEDVQGQTMLKEVTYALLPVGTSVDSADQFIIAGHTYRVDGEPWNLVSPLTGTAPGVLIKIEQVTG